MSVPSRAGLTLIETLAALTILSVAVAAGGNWLVSTARYSGALQRSTSDELAVVRTIELLRDDLFAVAQTTIPTAEHGVAVSPGGVVSLVTANGVPGDEPRWHRVEWLFDEESHEIIRRSRSIRTTENVSERIVALDVSEWLLAETEDTASVVQESSDILLTLSIGSASTRTIRFNGTLETAR